VDRKYFDFRLESDDWRVLGDEGPAVEHVMSSLDDERRIVLAEDEILLELHPNSPSSTSSTRCCPRSFAPLSGSAG
jgi:hypothetical protein